MAISQDRSHGLFNFVPRPMRTAVGLMMVGGAAVLASCAPGHSTSHIPTTWRGQKTEVTAHGQDPWMGIAGTEYNGVIAKTKTDKAQTVLLGKVTCGSTEFDNPVVHQEQDVTTVTGLAQDVPTKGNLGAFVAVLTDPAAHCTVDATNGSHTIDTSDTEQVVLNPEAVHNGTNAHTDQPVEGLAVMIIGGKPADGATELIPNTSYTSDPRLVGMEPADAQRAASAMAGYDAMAAWAQANS